MAYNGPYRLPRWLSFLGHQDDDKEPAKEQPKSGEMAIEPFQKSDETKEPEREDLVMRFDRVVRGDPDEASQVRLRATV